MNFKNKIFFYLLIAFGLSAYPQEIPPIQIFTPQDYGAEDQNWAITQAENNFIYVANNAGLLEYNGASWRLYNSPNKDILRSVKVVGDKIYSGGYMDFGYWKKNELGNLLYTSLTYVKNFPIQEDEEFWGIIDIEGYVLFQSLERIYIYNTTDETYGVIDSESRISKMFKVDETIYFQTNNKGIYKIDSGEAILMVPSVDIQNREIIGIYDFNDKLVFLTRENGFYQYSNNRTDKMNVNAEALFSTINIYSSTRLKDGSFILGTISNGIIQIDENGKELQRIDQLSGLSNNTVLSLIEDNYGNIWLGLDNGINVINLNSPFKVYKDKQGVLGTVYASIKTDTYLYLGTNQGLFYKPLDSNSKFNFIEGTKGQVWYLDLLKGVLFCGHDNGTFVIENNRAKKIASEKGAWIIKEIAEQPNLLLQGNYKGLNILEKTKYGWEYRNKIAGFDMSSRYFEFISSSEILINHEYKGVYKIEVDSSFSKVLNSQRIPIDEGVKSSISKYNNSILYSYKEGVFIYNDELNSFKKDSILSSLFGQERYVSGKLINDNKGNRLWGFSKNEIIYVESGKLSNEPQINTVPISSEIRNMKAGFENVLYLRNDNYLIGTSDGYLIIDINRLEQSSQEIYLNNVAYSTLYNEHIPLDLESSTELENETNNIRFKYSTTNYNKLTSSKYQYRLNGIYDNWSDWSSNSEVFFKNLPPGDYKFEARAETGGNVSSNQISYSFSIDKPWLLKPLAIVLYIILALILAYLVHYFNKRYYKKQKQELLQKKERELELEQLESQRQLMQFKNKNLRLDIENKNRELGTATMNLVKRNELLNNIKEELSKTKPLNEVQNVIKLINSNLNSTGDWKLFEEAFNNVDKDFMRTIKALHPSITPNDLRLCAYLRLNLSSKEIAPLLNISHKSVEVKRYRLRKKMGLSHDQSLSSYIIEL